MSSTAGTEDRELRQSRLAKFGGVLALMTLGYVGLNAAVSIWLGRLAFNVRGGALEDFRRALNRARFMGSCSRLSVASNRRRRACPGCTT
jgi:hypothetical protein